MGSASHKGALGFCGYALLDEKCHIILIVARIEDPADDGQQPAVTELVARLP
jgi:hypothetical protein